MAVGEGLYLDPVTGQMKRADMNDDLQHTLRKLHNEYVEDESMEFLTKAIKNLNATLDNSIVMRRDHPSYGYLKTDILAGMHRLEGLIHAWLIMRGNRSVAGSTSTVYTERATITSELGIDLADLKRRWKQS